MLEVFVLFSGGNSGATEDKVVEVVGDGSGSVFGDDGVSSAAFVVAFVVLEVD